MNDHRPALISYAMRLGCTFADAEDAIQDAWLKLARTGRVEELAGLGDDERLGKLKMRVRCAVFRQRRSIGQYCALDDLVDLVAPGPAPDAAFDLRLLRQALVAAGACEGESGLSGAGRVALHRRRVALRPVLAAWR